MTLLVWEEQNVFNKQFWGKFYKEVTSPNYVMR